MHRHVQCDKYLPWVGCYFFCVCQVAILLAPVAFVTHVDSVPLLTLAQLNTDQVGNSRQAYSLGNPGCRLQCKPSMHHLCHTVSSSRHSLPHGMPCRAALDKLHSAAPLFLVSLLCSL
jgi:hypothetical protein